MAENNEQIIIDVEIDTKKVQQNLSQAISGLASLKEEQRMLRKEIEKGNDADGEKAKRLAEVNKMIDMNNRAVRSNTALLQAENDTLFDTNASLDEQRQQLKQLQNLYGSLSGDAKRMADAEGGLRDQIKQVAEAVKAQESAIGDDRRNVGNYKSALEGLGDTAHTLKDGMEGLAGGSTAAGKAMDGVDKVAKAFAKNPIVGVLAIIVMALSALAEKMRENDQQMKEVQVATASLTSVFKVFEPIVKKVAEVLGNTLVKAIDWATSAIKKMLGWVDKLGQWLGKDWHFAEMFEEAAAAAQQAAQEMKGNTEELRRLREERIKYWAMEQERAAAEQEVLERLNSAFYTAEQAAQRAADAQLEAVEQMQRLLQVVQEDEEEGEDVPSPEEMARKTFGLDDEGVAYFMSLIKKGQTAHEAGMNAMSEQSKRMAKNVAAAMGSLGGSFGDLSEALGAFGEENEAAAKASKAFALAAILANQAQSISEGALAISAGVAQAQSVPFPANIAAIITTVAAITGVLASTASSFVQAKQLFAQADAVPTDVGKYATGGYIPRVAGVPTTGDNLTAHVNPGEVILTPTQQRVFMDYANGRGVGLDYGAMAEVMVAAVAAQPAPVMDYAEFAEFGQKVTTYNEIASI